MKSHEESLGSQFLHVIIPIVIVLIIAGISIYLDFGNPDGSFWFQRSGALIVATGIYIAFHENRKRLQKDNSTLKFFTKIWYRWLALTLGLLGTLIWAYGDLFFSASLSFEAHRNTNLQLVHDTLKNPLTYILLVNILTLVWAVSSWKKGIRERWVNNLRDAASELIGAAEMVYSETSDNKKIISPKTKSNFIAKEQKFILLFIHNETEKNELQDKVEELRKSAEDADISNYRNSLNQFSELIKARVIKEWSSIK